MNINWRELGEFITRLNWHRLGLFAIFGVVCILLITAYDNRQRVYNSILIDRLSLEHRMLTVRLPADLESRIQRTIQDERVAFEIVTADFRRNTRSTAYFYTRNPIIQERYQQRLSRSLEDSSLFGTVEAHNQQLIRTINGDFDCVAYSASRRSTIMGALQDVKTICTMSIPPFYGKFTGYMVYYLTVVPTADQLHLIRLLMTEISHDIYRRALY